MKPPPHWRHGFPPNTPSPYRSPRVVTEIAQNPGRQDREAGPQLFRRSRSVPYGSNDPDARTAAAAARAYSSRCWGWGPFLGRLPASLLSGGQQSAIAMAWIRRVAQVSPGLNPACRTKRIACQTSPIHRWNAERCPRTSKRRSCSLLAGLLTTCRPPGNRPLMIARLAPRKGSGEARCQSEGSKASATPGHPPSLSHHLLGFGRRSVPRLFV